MNIKIGHPSGSQKLITRKNLPVNQARRSGSNQMNSFSTAETSETVLKQVKLVKLTLSNPDFVKSMPLKIALPPLKEILLLLGESRLDPGDADFRLLERFLDSWIKKYGESLPEKGRKELQALRNLLGSIRSEQEKDNKENIFYGNLMEEEKNRTRWRVSLRQEQNDHGVSEKEEKVHCVLDLFCLNLGNIKVVLSSEKKQMNCRIFSGQSSSRRIIRKSLARFRDTLQHRGLNIPVFTVKRMIREEIPKPYKEGRGIGLWG